MPRGLLSGVTRSRRGLLAAWLALAVAALLLGECQPLHVHADPGGGLYNESHVLGALATLNGDAPLPAAADAAWLHAPVARALPALQTAPAAFAGQTEDSRAPPRA
jgi:hypothetical protein